MRTLYLCRHADSAWAEPGQPDHARPLSPRGLRDAAAMAQRFTARGGAPPLLLSSDALRARTTAGSFAQALGLDEGAIGLEPRLYHASAEAIAEVVAALPAACGAALLFGHNPGISVAVAYFCGDGVGVMPTCGLVRIDFEADAWQGTGLGTGTLAWFDHPAAPPPQ